jgi:FdrA protein
VIERVIIRRGTFLDSVALMMASREVAKLDGIATAAVVNATPFNLELVERQGFTVADGEDPGPDDLLIALRAEDEAAVERGLAALDEQLRREPAATLRGDQRAPARSLRAAARRDPELSLALVSVPGAHATYECAQALEGGLDVFCFSSGLPLEAEVALKALARERSLLLMGPDCGTAILNGVGLGFANAVRPGPVGIVGASGTGMQAITCLLDAAGVGISHAIGVGGRDLHQRVGGAMTLRGLELLADDAETEAIVIVAKSPAPEVAEAVGRAARETGKPAVICFPGLDEGSAAALSFEPVVSLEQAAAAAAECVSAQPPAPARWGSLAVAPGAIRGLYSGGTLRDEARGIIAAAVSAVGTDLDGEGGHVLVDLGDERFTEGRPHPMIDPSLRIEVLDEQSRDPSVGVLLLDVVLGYGAHPDPAAELGPAIAAALERRPGKLACVISICGTEHDPQGLQGQAERLLAAGATVTRSNADAARLALVAAGVTEAGA